MEPKVELKLMKEIDHITEMFDFEKVHKVMKFLNWRWYFREDKNDPFSEATQRVPKISEMIFEAKEKLIRAGNLAYDNEEKYTVSSGGFIASAYYDKEEGEWYLDLIFGIEESTT